ncbi:MAG: DinB family protein [Dehalococcoidia bacterium]
MSQILADLFWHNLWANLRLLDVCASLDEEHLSASAPGTYGAVRDTFQHLLSSEGRYVVTFPGDRPEPALNEGQPFPGFPTLRERSVASGEALISLAESTPDSQRLTGEWRGQPYDIPASVMFTQAINHATEHRAHIVSILSQRGVLTPRLDAIGYQIATAGSI